MCTRRSASRGCVWRVGCDGEYIHWSWLGRVCMWTLCACVRVRACAHAWCDRVCGMGGVRACVSVVCALKKHV
jgi:hypothetical protein